MFKKLGTAFMMILLMASVSWGAARTHVTKDSAGFIGHVTGYVTESGQTVFQIDASSGVSFYIQVLNMPPGSGVSQVSSGTSGYIAVYNSSNSLTGVSTISGSSIYGGTVPAASLPDPSTAGVSTTSVIRTSNIITGRSKDVFLTGATLYEFPISGTSGIWISGISSPSRSPTAGVSIRMGAPDAAGYDAVIFLPFSTYIHGTTTYVLFPSGVTLCTADTITPGVSKYIISGTTDAQKVILHSTGASTWFITTVGSPTVSWQ